MNIVERRDLCDLMMEQFMTAYGTFSLSLLPVYLEARINSLHEAYLVLQW